jgi:hypothetical protein
MCVLATDQQLCDLARFCLGNPSSVLSIDPTFNLGPFYVTPITYQSTLGLVVSRAERRLVSNLATGVQFLGKESNSHYHAHRVCLVKADATFSGAKLVVPPDVKENLNAYQRMYLATCLGVPAEVLGGVLPTFSTISTCS